MSLDPTRTRQWLQSFDFPKLFVEELGWDRHQHSLDIDADGATFRLKSVAEKRGMVAYVCHPASGSTLPTYATRRKIERVVSKVHFEHLIVFIDPAKTMQLWQWVKREPGRPAASREHQWHKSQPGDALIQKLGAVVFTLEEEESITGMDVTSRVRAGFDVERVTKKFYEQFKAEHEAFTKFIKGIPDEEMHRWYVSVMLNRLCGLVLTNSRGGVDAVDGDGHLFEIKSTTTASVSTARDAGLHTIAKWRKRYWLIASGESLNKGYVITNLYIAHPDDLEPFFQKTEQRLKKLNRVCGRVLKAAKKSGAADADIAVVQDILERRGVTLNNPAISLKLVGERATQLDPNKPAAIVKSIRAFAKRRPIVVSA